MGRRVINIPKSCGTYVLLMHLRAERRLRIGSLGWVVFAGGWYTYVGSAFGPGGLAARIGRHLRRDKNRHWHVDYLRWSASAAGLWISDQAARREHEWAALLALPPISGSPIHGFGATDCTCGAHLFHFVKCPDPRLIADCLQAAWISLQPGSASNHQKPAP